MSCTQRMLADSSRQCILKEGHKGPHRYTKRSPHALGPYADIEAFLSKLGQERRMIREYLEQELDDIETQLSIANHRAMAIGEMLKLLNDA